MFGLLHVGKSLTLNDSCWIVEIDFKGTFKEYNLYENTFDQSIASVAFTGQISNPIRGTLPELTTGGSLAKAWRIINNDVYLYIRKYQ